MDLSNPNAMKHRCVHAFTLVELLVVIGIIAILISLLMPALNRARKSAQQVACMSQIRQLAIGLLAYAGEHKGALPPHIPNGGSYGVYDFANPDLYSGAHPNCLGSIMPYVPDHRIFACPSLDRDLLYFGLSSTPQSDTNYMGNDVILGRKIQQVRRSAEVVAYQEWNFRSDSAWPRPALIRSIPSPRTFTWWHSTNIGYEEYTNAHYERRNPGDPSGGPGGGNLAFVDGHAEFRRYKDLKASDFGLTGGAGVSGNANDDWQSPYWNTYSAEVGQ